MIFCFDATGALLWETPTRCGSPCSMAFLNDKLYAVTSEGAFVCIDVSDAAIARAAKAAPAKPKRNTLASIGETSRVVEDAQDAGSGVIVECVRDGGKLRVRVVSPGYNADWYCQFPRDIREAGAKYVVDAVREASQGGFYRVIGDIKRLRN